MKKLIQYIHDCLDRRMERKLDKAFAPINTKLDDARLKLLLINKFNCN